MKYYLMLLLLIALEIQAQSIENINATAVGQEVVLNYSLIGEESDVYNVEVYVAANETKEFSQQIKLIDGDLNSVKVGTDKKITWKAKEEMGDFSGKVQFKIIAKKVSLSTIKKLECAIVELKKISQIEKSIIIEASITSNYNGWIMLKNTEVKMIDNNSNVFTNPAIQTDKSSANKLITVESGEKINANITFKNINKTLQNISSFEFYVQSDGYCTARFNSNQENAYFKFTNLSVE